MQERVHCCDEATSHQLPVAVAFWIIHIVSAERCLSLMQNLVPVHCFTRSVILNVMATQYTCSLDGIYHLHQRVQWSRHCSHMCLLVHCFWLPGCVNVCKLLWLCYQWLDFFQTELVCLPRFYYPFVMDVKPVAVSWLLWTRECRDLLEIWFQFSGLYARSGVAGPYGRGIFNVEKNEQ